MNSTAHWTGLLTALGVGLLIGVVRERRHQPGRTKAGTRTHLLVAILGNVSWSLGTSPFVATVLVVGALVIGGYQATAQSDPGQTGEAALLTTLMLSALAQQNPSLSAALGVLAAAMLHAKQASQHISRVLITDQELQDALILAAAALVVMPLLSDQAMDPWGVLQPTTLWRIVVLVMAVGMLGHVAQRVLGGRWGMPLAAFFSGFVSSTAVVVSTGQRVRSGQSDALPAAACALLANLASLTLFAGVLGAASPTLLFAMRWPLVLAVLGLLLVVLLALRRIDGDGAKTPIGRAFKLTHALGMASIIALMSLLAAWLQHFFGDVGVLVAALCVAWVEVHAAAASIAQLIQTGGMTPEWAHWALVAVLASSAVAKTTLAMASGGIRYGLTVGLGFVAMVVGGVVGVLWFV
ncbi:MgtC/SapB family protein [Limnohabitans sp. 15K]|uniref:MgtC/SapB family protein n=1 Tax=Limnohabitans sp. 15K TaxID=1100706 RepID=UPI000C1E973B|nr:MgtC/SapB family protein [Limnohabitans sp. 15K]PIT80036.1 hypothetical protein B9Z40_15485 [Limnohabitans sp. 15K]